MNPVHYATDPREAYKAYRASGYKAADAWARARCAWLPVFARKKTYRREIGPNVRRSAWGAVWTPSRDSYRWGERADSNMRFVGAYHDIMRERLYARDLHKGWYLSDENDTGETTHGVVYQLTGRNGKPRYVAGGSDQNNEGAAYVCLTEIFDDKHDAARAADSHAEHYAERERDYKAAWGAGNQIAEMRIEISAERKAALELCAELRALRKLHTGADFPSACEALRGAIKAARRSIAKLRREMESLRDSYEWRNRDAFKEGLGNA